MTIYSINLGIGRASSGVEYAQAYRASLFRKLGVEAKFIFTQFIARDTIIDLTRQLGFNDEEIIWFYTFFTDQRPSSTSYTLEQLKADLAGHVTQIEEFDDFVRLYYEQDDSYLTAYLKAGSATIVHRVEYVSSGNLIRKDYFTYMRSFTEYYSPKDGKAHLYQRRFFNEDGSVALDELLDGQQVSYQKDGLFYDCKEALIAEMMQELSLTKNDVVILDRATGLAQPVFRHVKPAKLVVVIHAEHYSPHAVTKETILWNNYYEYQFTYADRVDAFLTATDQQAKLMADQFKRYSGKEPKIRTIPVGSLEGLRRPQQARKPYSILTVSRLAPEKHLDWLIEAVVIAQKQIPQLQFTIYGAGGEQKRLEQLILDRQAQSFIHLKGHQVMKERYQEYQLYLSASTSEGFGLTLLEALGSGLPLIGLDVPYGNQTFIQDGKNGFLVPRLATDDVAVLAHLFAEKIQLFFSDTNQTAFQEQAYQLAESYLDQAVEAKWLALIKELTDDYIV